MTWRCSSSCRPRRAGPPSWTATAWWSWNASHRGGRVREDRHKMSTSIKVSIVFPCYNEAGRLPRTLERYLAHFPRDPEAVEAVVVDDGSTDATFALAQAAAAGDQRVRVVRTEPNHGKGFAVRTGMLAAGGERIVFTDADGSYDPEQADRVLAALGSAPVAIGARGLAPG